LQRRGLRLRGLSGPVPREHAGLPRLRQVGRAGLRLRHRPEQPRRRRALRRLQRRRWSSRIEESSTPANPGTEKAFKASTYGRAGGGRLATRIHSSRSTTTTRAACLALALLVLAPSFGATARAAETRYVLHLRGEPSADVGSSFDGARVVAVNAPIQRVS